MIRLCPFCGYNLSRPLVCGITTCDNCCRVFDSCPYHRTLCAGWIVRKWHIYDPDTLRNKFGFLDQELAPVITYVIQEGLTHEEFIKVVSIDRFNEMSYDLPA